MMNEKFVNEEFKPQFPVRSLRSDYVKMFSGAFFEGRRIVKFTRRKFRTADEAHKYSAIVLGRYRRLVNAATMSVAMIEQK